MISFFLQSLWVADWVIEVGEELAGEALKVVKKTDN
jgi:hypothetical protein